MGIHVKKGERIDFFLQFNEKFYNNKAESGTLDVYKVVPRNNLVSNESIIIDIECSRKLFFEGYAQYETGQGSIFKVSCL